MHDHNLLPILSFQWHRSWWSKTHQYSLVCYDHLLCQILLGCKRDKEVDKRIEHLDFAFAPLSIPFSSEAQHQELFSCSLETGYLLRLEIKNFLLLDLDVSSHCRRIHIILAYVCLKLDQQGLQQHKLAFHDESMHFQIPS